MEKMISLLRGQDQYGYPISLNYKKEGSMYQTKLGGGTSLFVNIAVGLFFFFKCKTMLTYGDSKVGRSELSKTDEQLDHVYKAEDI
jgi:hypothetical protein